MLQYFCSGRHTCSELGLTTCSIFVDADTQRLNAFLHRSIRQGFCPSDLTDITDIFDAADERLFCKILHHPNHLLAHLLPKESHTPYHLRPRRHNRQLTPKINKLYDSNFVQRMLYKDLYWLIDNFLYVCIVFYIFVLCLSCWAAFCQLKINEYFNIVIAYLTNAIVFQLIRWKSCCVCSVLLYTLPPVCSHIVHNNWLWFVAVNQY